MKKLFVVTAVLMLYAGVFAAPAGFYGENTSEMKSAPSEVRVYNGWALVKRVVKAQAAAGESVLVVPDLPPNAVHNSISVSKQDKAALFMIKEFDYRDIMADPEAGVDDKKNAAKVEELRAQIKSKEDRITVVEQQLKFYASILAKTSDETSKAAGSTAVSTENLGQTVKFVATGTESSLKEKRSLEKDLLKLREELSIAESMLNRVRQQGAVPKKVLYITLKSEALQQAAMDISYVVPGVYWYPAYETDFNTKKNSVEGRYSAVITQTTGEEWKNVRLTIAAGTPLFDVTVPEARPWILSEYKPQVLYKKSAAASAPMAMKSMAVMEEAYDAGAPAPESYESSVAAVSDTGSGIDVELSGRYSVSGNGMEKKVFIKNIKFGTGELTYLAVPSVNEYAYLTAEFENKDEIPLVPGEVSVFMDGNYTGKARIDKRIATGEKASFPFGIDERVKITRDRLWRKKGETGILGGNESTDFAFRIKIENFRSAETKLTIKEPLPFPQHEKIKIDYYEVSPEISETKDSGITLWHLTLKPSEKKEITYKFRVIHPKDMQVTGY